MSFKVDVSFKVDLWVWVHVGDLRAELCSAVSLWIRKSAKCRECKLRLMFAEKKKVLLYYFLINCLLDFKNACLQLSESSDFFSPFLAGNTF